MSMHLRRLELALHAMLQTYRLWYRWQDSQVAETRRMGLKAKTFGLIAYDRIMIGEHHV
ncbi:hypothetical protein D3C77_34400 [compost metagenome]